MSSQRQTLPTFTKSGEQLYHAPTPNSMRCHRAHECNDDNSYINSNGSHTIIFHIIHTFMLTHQLACIDISFPIHISSHSIPPITCKQNTWANFQSKHQPELLNSPIILRGLSMDSPLIKHRFHFFGTEIHGHFRPHNTQNHFHGLLNKEYPSRRRPLPLRVAETP